MSVMIRGMEIPAQCAGCKLWTLNHFKDTLQDICRVLERPVYPYARDKDCPLISIPPHGDLIDRVEFYKDINESVILTDAFKEAFNLWYDEQPTIIPAEEET